MIGGAARGALAAGVATAGYSLLEPYSFRLVTRRLEVEPWCPPLNILHVSDTHLGPHNRPLARFLRGLPDRLEDVCDLVLATGDLIEGSDGIEPVIEVLAGLEARFGRFYVLGSHDYYESRFQFYSKYLSGPSANTRAPLADTQRLEAGLRAGGWVSVANRTEIVDCPLGRLRISGVDDPYIQRHRTGHIRRESGEDVAIGLVHAPDVVSEWVLAGFDLVLAGHTHAGQVRVPGFGALVTNSSLPRGLAGGAHRVGHAWLHVSPGLGHSRYAPVRLAARPEVTLLKLVPTAGR